MSADELAELVARGKKYAALVVTATVVAVVVLVLDYMIKNAIMQQIRAADRAVRLGSEPPNARPEPPFRGGDVDPSRGPVGRGGMVSGAGMGEGPPAGPVAAPGSMPHRMGGPPISTDGDNGRASGRPTGAGPVEIQPDGPPNPAG
jgi:hypothetical protein